MMIIIIILILSRGAFFIYKRVIILITCNKILVIKLTGNIVTIIQSNKKFNNCVYHPLRICVFHHFTPDPHA